jgi:hypothetical protein
MIVTGGDRITGRKKGKRIPSIFNKVLLLCISFLRVLAVLY